MQTITQELLVDNHQTISTLIRSYDAHAQIYLFGPGTKHYGQMLDVYIASEKINKNNVKQIKHQLVKTYKLNVDFVCLLADKNDVMTQIAEKIT